jgi:hypothetical protein
MLSWNILAVFTILFQKMSVSSAPRPFIYFNEVIARVNFDLYEIYKQAIEIKSYNQLLGASNSSENDIINDGAKYIDTVYNLKMYVEVPDNAIFYNISIDIEKEFSEQFA